MNPNTSPDRGDDALTLIPSDVAFDPFRDFEMNSEDAGVIFPSLDPKNRRNLVKRLHRDKGVPMHHLSTNSALYAQMIPKNRGGRPKKAVTESLEPKKSIGRPRIHPAKEVDPNKPKRVAKGDKPLGRPRTSHLKPSTDKRVVGRPRKDPESEGIWPQEETATILAPASNNSGTIISKINPAPALESPTNMVE